jgi:hypothetical protein
MVFLYVDDIYLMEKLYIAVYNLWRPFLRLRSMASYSIYK